ncbi:hypothetical protein BDV95DRAFT_644394 [Massariosphaeria phaeospora]|uniref:Uncharacterized protein n=1 Tax=Massariosphaeria phaeospora TaxID=100035 RepID=A0A7C8IPQ5_9PLEO|nr:hypothetical protein BDV95DRAFT_644394 [Massariosphaeria phaeospora]
MSWYVMDKADYATALDPEICKLCSEHLSASVEDYMCDRCRNSLSDPPGSPGEDLMFLRKGAYKIFQFLMDFGRETGTHCDFEEDTEAEGSYIFQVGLPGQTRALPEFAGCDEKTRRCLDYVYLSWSQCDGVLIMIPSIMKEEFIFETIREYYYEPKHPSCRSHVGYRVKMVNGDEYSLGFTDRQLGWLPLVSPWSEFYDQRVRRERTSGKELGYQRDVVKGDLQERGVTQEKIKTMLDKYGVLDEDLFGENEEEEQDGDEEAGKEDMPMDVELNRAYRWYLSFSILEEYKEWEREEWEDL